MSFRTPAAMKSVGDVKVEKDSLSRIETVRHRQTDKQALFFYLCCM